MNKLFRFSNLVALFVLCGLIYFPFLGEVNLFDWDETLISSVSKEMYLKGEVLQPWLTGKYFLDYPPFFFWLQAFSFNYLHVNEYAARIPNAILSLLVILTLYKNGKRIFGRGFGMIWSTIYMSMLLPQIYHKSALIEPWFCFFIYLSLYNMSRVIEMRQENEEGFFRSRDVFANLFYSAFAMAGALMCKGIEGYIIVVLSYWLLFVFSSAKYGFGYKNILKWNLYIIFLLLIWIGVENRWHGLDYLKQFYHHQISELNLDKASWTHRATFHFIILFIGCFPASAFCFNSVKLKSYESSIQKVFRLMMVSSLIIILIVASLFKHKIAHFSVFAYYPISYLAAYSIRYILMDQLRIRKLTYGLLLAGGVVWSIALTIIPLSRSNLGFIKQYIHEDTLYHSLSSYHCHPFEMYLGIGYVFMFLLSIILFLFKKSRMALFIIFFGTMIVSEIVLIYFLPKIEQMTQGAQVEFIKQNKEEKAVYHYCEGKSYIAHFYTDSSMDDNSIKNIDSIKAKKTKSIPHYFISKTSDTINLAPYKSNLKELYNQGIYTFYKLK